MELCIHLTAACRWVLTPAAVCVSLVKQPLPLVPAAVGHGGYRSERALLAVRHGYMSQSALWHGLSAIEGQIPRLKPGLIYWSCQASLSSHL